MWLVANALIAWIYTATVAIMVVLALWLFAQVLGAGAWLLAALPPALLLFTGYGVLSAMIALDPQLVRGGRWPSPLALAHRLAGPSLMVGAGTAATLLAGATGIATYLLLLPLWAFPALATLAGAVAAAAAFARTAGRHAPGLLPGFARSLSGMLMAQGAAGALTVVVTEFGPGWPAPLPHLAHAVAIALPLAAAVAIAVRALQDGQRRRTADSFD